MTKSLRRRRRKTKRMVSSIVDLGCEGWKNRSAGARGISVREKAHLLPYF